MTEGRRGRHVLGGVTAVVAIGVAAVAIHAAADPGAATDPSGAATRTTGQAATPTPAPAGSVSGGQVVEPGPGQPVATDAEPVVGPAGQVSVVVTFAGWSEETDAAEVTGIVTGVVEDGGTCRLALIGPGDSAVVESSAVADATTTSCGSLRVPGDELDPGTWEAVLSYESTTSSGASESFEVEVPES